jgi:hypothetical protein
MKQLALLLVAAMAASQAGAEAADAGATPPRLLIVVAKSENLEANHYLWAAQIAANRLPGANKQVLEGGFSAAIAEASKNPSTVRGIVEIIFNVYSWDEDVTITCYSAAGKKLWRKKSSANMGGNEEYLARKMFERTLEKAEKMPACGSGQ